ncbi:MAG: N-acetyltransferase family protein [Sphingomonas bacterium]
MQSSGNGLSIADLREWDLPAALSIYNDVIATTTAVYSEAPVTADYWAGWFAARRSRGLPVLGAYQDGELIGFGSFGEFRPWPCYETTVEHSIHIRADRRRQGAGTRLVQSLMERAAGAGKHVMIAGIDAENLSSLALHAKLGFIEVGRLPAVARKFGRWLDLVYLHRKL